MTVTTHQSAAAESHAWPAACRWGGLAAWVVAATYVIGFAAMVVHFVPAGFTSADSDPVASLTFLLDHQASLHLWYFLLYLVGGAGLVVLVLGVHDRSTRSQPGLSRISTAFGLIWAGHLLASGLVALVGQRAVARIADDGAEHVEITWVALAVVQDALGGGIELVGAIWLCLVSAMAIRGRVFSRGLAALGVTMGIAGLLTVVPAASDIAATVFGLGLIVWFVQAGLELRRRSG